MKKYYLLIFLFFAGLIISAINPHDYFTWILEIFPAILGLIALVLTFKCFRFSYFTYNHDPGTLLRAVYWWALYLCHGAAI